LLEIANHFNSGESGESEIGDKHLYANRWILVNKIRIFTDGDILERSLNRVNYDILRILEDSGG